MEDIHKVSLIVTHNSDESQNTAIHFIADERDAETLIWCYIQSVRDCQVALQAVNYEPVLMGLSPAEFNSAINRAFTV